MKELKDYLHFYIGCEIFWGDETSPHSGTLVGMTGSNTKTNYRAEIRTKQTGESSYHCFTPLVSQCKIALRHLSDMTEEEMKEIGWDKLELSHAISQERNRSLYTNEWLFLLSRGFDLFGLIEEKLALDKAKLK